LKWLFDNTQQEIEAGTTTTHDALTIELQRAVKAACAASQFGGKGKSKIEIKIELESAKGMIEPKITYKVTLPKPQAQIPSLFYPTPDGGFSKADPRQLEIFASPRVGVAQ
jgi:hypothetical protein